MSTPLHRAAAAGDAERIRRLIVSGHDIHCINDCGWTPLHEAVLSGDVASVIALLDAGANPQAQDEDGESPLDLASGDEALLDALPDDQERREYSRAKSATGFACDVAEAEANLQNATFLPVLVNITIVMLAYQIISFLGSLTPAGQLIDAVLVVFVVVFVIPGWPEMPVDEMPEDSRFLLSAGKWVPRGLFGFAWIWTDVVFTGGDAVGWLTDSQWVFLLVMTLLGLPLIWFAVWKIRQFAMAAATRMLSGWCIVAAGGVAAIQSYGITFATSAWFSTPMLPPLGGQTGNWLWGIAASSIAVALMYVGNQLLARIAEASARARFS